MAYYLVMTKKVNEIQLDLKDRKIISELDFNARKSYSEIAKKVGLSKQVVEYRITNLMKQGVIQGFYAVVQMPKLGYLYCRLSLTLQNISPAEFNEIMDELKKDNRIFWLFEMQGSFDLFIASWMKNLTEFRRFVEEFMVKYGPFVKKRTENIATDVIHYQYRFLLNKEATGEIHLAETEQRISIDDLDKKILSFLCENARMSLVEMGEKLKEHPKTIAYRIARMEKIKLIEAYRVNLDHNRIGYTYYKIFVNISNFTFEDITRLKEFIKRYTNTIYIIEGINLHGDIDFEVMIKSNADLFEFIKLLRKEFPKIVGDYSSVIYMNIAKVKYLPF